MAAVLDQPWQLTLFGWQRWKHMLRIEVNTGMRHSRGSVLRAVNQYFGTNFRRKEQAIAYLDECIEWAEAIYMKEPDGQGQGQEAGSEEGGAQA
jgi:hypothetical protein